MRILLTGGAGFIGSNLADGLLQNPLVKEVRVLDNLSTGSVKNITHLLRDERFTFIEGDIRDFDTCIEASKDIDCITHQAALGSVPRSIQDPGTTNAVNISGTLNIFMAARQQGIKRIVYAASSSTYGDLQGLPKVEDQIGNPLSPYAVTKLVNELYARVFSQLYDMEFIGLRYFNIFGPRQNPQGPYAAVIPLFVKALMNGVAPVINGDGSHSRDFTYVTNAVNANIAALLTEDPAAVNQVYNIACSTQTSLSDLFVILKKEAGSNMNPVYGPERAGDVKHSLADISKAGRLLKYTPVVKVNDGLKKTFKWYKANPDRL